MDQQKINYLASTIRDTDLYTDGYQEFLDACSDIICRFDPDVAIAVFEELGREDDVLAIKVNYGY